MFLSRFTAGKNLGELLADGSSDSAAITNLAPNAACLAIPEIYSENDQIIVVIEGAVIGKVANKMARMFAGDAVIIPAGVAHCFENEGPSVARTATFSTRSFDSGWRMPPGPRLSTPALGEERAVGAVDAGNWLAN